jgi:hypothetical protein
VYIISDDESLFVLSSEVGSW